MTEPLTVEELERVAREIVSMISPFVSTSEAFEERCTWVKGRLRQHDKSHSRQLWLEAAPWISVSERLPRPTKVVLVYDSDGWIGTAALYTDKTWSTRDVTHWMPLPSRPAVTSGRDPAPSSPKELESSEKGSTPKPSPALPREEK